MSEPRYSAIAVLQPLLDEAGRTGADEVVFPPGVFDLQAGDRLIVPACVKRIMGSGYQETVLWKE